MGLHCPGSLGFQGSVTFMQPTCLSCTSCGPHSVPPGTAAQNGTFDGLHDTFLVCANMCPAKAGGIVVLLGTEV